MLNYIILLSILLYSFISEDCIIMLNVLLWLLLYLLLSLSFFFALDQEKHFYYFMEWIYTFFLFHGVFLYYFILLWYHRFLAEISIEIFICFWFLQIQCIDYKCVMRYFYYVFFLHFPPTVPIELSKNNYNFLYY